MGDLIDSVVTAVGFGGADSEPRCGCETEFDGDRLVVDAAGCDADGRIERSPDCRATVVDALAVRDADLLAVRTAGLERVYDGTGAALLVAAGRFVERAAAHDEGLTARCRHDPLGAGRVAAGRAGVVADLAAETGLAECARAAEDYEAVFQPTVAPTPMRSLVTVDPPREATLVDRRDLPTGATARIYEVADRDLRRYHLVPPELDLDRRWTRVLERAHRLLATGGVRGGERAPGRAVRRVAPAEAPVSVLTRALRKHTRGIGVLTDCFGDHRVSDVYATSPVERNPLRVVVDDEVMRSNVRLTSSGADALASRFRRESGRAFSRASPALDASVSAGGDTVRVAGLTDPVADGIAFAFRASDDDPWTLPALVENGTLPARAAGFLSLAVRRSAAVLVAGPRGAGKTTMLDALLWELPTATRVVAIEDTPELSVGALQRHGRDVQPVRTTTGEEAGLTAVEGLRTALRLGDGAIVLGEVRGEEAAVLYEAMRVGAQSNAVLGTIHGDGAAAVRERVVEDLDVPASSFGATDLVVTLDTVRTESGRRRRLAAVEEVVGTDRGTEFATLFGRSDGELTATGRIDRGESTVLSSLSAPGESYADVLAAITARTDRLRRRSKHGRTAPQDLTDVEPD